jgi:beta-galactosidase GanA
MLASEPFLYGASFYGEWLPRERWDGVLATLTRAEMNVVRIGDAAWGVLEPAPGDYRLDQLTDQLDAATRYGLRVIVATPTFIAPQWLLARYPEARVQLAPGVPMHPMQRKAACIHHHAYRAACRAMIAQIASTCARHPAVIGWQLDNEIDAIIAPCYCDACERAWHVWLAEQYGTVEHFNRRLRLDAWSLQVTSFADVPQPHTQSYEHTNLPALTLASRRFRRDAIASFLRLQRDTLREHGVRS